MTSPPLVIASWSTDFARDVEEKPHAVIPAKAGIHFQRKCAQNGANSNGFLSRDPEFHPVRHREGPGVPGWTEAILGPRIDSDLAETKRVFAMTVYSFDSPNQ